MRRPILAGLLLILSLAACSPASTATPQPTTGVPAGGSPTAAQSPLVSSLTLDQLRNMPYQLLNASSLRSATLTDGAFTAPDPASPDYVRAQILDNVAFTDLDGDGKVDAAVLLAENYGGSGNFVSLIAMLNRNGQPKQDASFYIDDRPHINSLTAENGVITLDVVVHAPDDPMCCATQRKVMNFTLTEGGLAPQTITSFTPEGKERSIVIDSPADGAEASGSVRLSGSSSISPFENTLAYKIYNTNGAELVAGPMTVTAAELGGPGTFDTTVDLSAIPSGTPVRIAVQDISAADGSIMAMDSVEVTVK